MPERKIEGRNFNNFQEFYQAVRNQQTYSLRIFGKKLEKLPSTTRPGQNYYEMVDDPESYVDARIHKIVEQGANLNILEEGEVVYYFRLTNKNIAQFKIGLL